MTATRATMTSWWATTKLLTYGVGCTSFVLGPWAFLTALAAGTLLLDLALETSISALEIDGEVRLQPVDIPARAVRVVVVLAPHLWARGAQPSEELGAALGAALGACACVSACAARTCACACADATDTAATAAGCGCRHARWCRRAWRGRQRRHRCIAWRVMAALRSAAAAAAAAAAARVAPAVATVL